MVAAPSPGESVAGNESASRGKIADSQNIAGLGTQSNSLLLDLVRFRAHGAGRGLRWADRWGMDRRFVMRVLHETPTRHPGLPLASHREIQGYPGCRYRQNRRNRGWSPGSPPGETRFCRFCRCVLWAYPRFLGSPRNEVSPVLPVCPGGIPTIFGSPIGPLNTLVYYIYWNVPSYGGTAKPAKPRSRRRTPC
jgi:hypothetical protein